MKAFVKSATLVTGANIVFAGGLLLRNILLAKLLPIEQYGIAATLMILASFAEAAQDTGMNRLIVQSGRGDEAVYQRTLHSVQVAFGLLAALAAVVLAAPFAELVGGLDALSAYVAVGAFASLSGLVHLDVYRRQRHGDFRAYALLQAVPTFVGVAAIYPSFLVFGDFRAALCMIFAQQLARVAVSHLSAERRWRIGFNRSDAQEAARFGLPLMLNGALVFLAFNGDRVIVANMLGLETVAWFSVALMLTLSPANILATTMRALALPQLARRKDDQAAFECAACGVMEFALVGGLALIGAAIALGPVFVSVFFGAAYAPAAMLFPALSAAQAFRLVRAGATLAAVSRAETQNPLYTNIIRCAFLPAAAIAAGESVAAVALVAAAAELAALIAALWLLARRLGVRLGRAALPFGLAGAAIASAFLGGTSSAPNLAAFTALSMAAILTMSRMRTLLVAARWRTIAEAR